MMIEMTKVMIVEKDPSIVKELKMHLGYLCCDVISVVDSGEKALEILGTASDGDTGAGERRESETGTDKTAVMPDVILMDIGLGFGTHLMNATDTAKEIRMACQIPIIFIVGHADEEFICNVKLDFPFGYILTPISTRELKVTIDIAIYTAKIEAERINAQKELRKSDERYKALIDNMPSGLAIYKVVGDGEDFIFIDFNKTAEKIDGQKREELIGRSIFEARPGVQEFGIVDTLKNVWRTGKLQHHPVSLYQDGRIKRYYDNYIYKLSSGEIVAIFRDETLKKQFEHEMKQLEYQLNHAQKMEAIGIMAGGIAHDFNNILFPILGAAEMLIEESSEGTMQKEFLNEILKAGHRAKELVKQILTFSRQHQQEVLPLSIQPIAKEIIKLSRAMLPSTIKINQDIPKNSCMVMADPTHIHQVFMNLITNAFHAMEDTGGTLTIRLSETENPAVYIHNYETGKRAITDKGDKGAAEEVNTNVFSGDVAIKLASGKYLCIEVSDTGIGMDDATRQKIFEPYFTTKELGKGTGLGLAVVHGIVKGYKGGIKVTSEPGKGTSFKIYLPGTDQKTFNSDEVSNLQNNTGNETILVVDDEQVVVKMLGIILQRAGYRVFTKTDSLEALELFRQKPDMYNLVITDLTMPGLTGDKLCAALKMVKPDIPVILCTGFSTKSSDLQKSDFGIDRVIMKPIVSHDLLKTVRELLDGKNM